MLPYWEDYLTVAPSLMLPTFVLPSQFSVVMTYRLRSRGSIVTLGHPFMGRLSENFLMISRLNQAQKVFSVDAPLISLVPDDSGAPVRKLSDLNSAMMVLAR